MTRTPVFIGQTPWHAHNPEVIGSYVEFDQEEYYKISNYDQMRPFFISLVSSSDHWLFLSSNGALTAGRKNPETALFPYYTDDKIHDSQGITGSLTVIRMERDGKTYLWEPFSDRYDGAYGVTRSLYKNAFGTKVVFEEVNEDLQLRFRYGWYSSDRFGIVRKAWLENLGDSSAEVDFLDGIQNLLPYGVTENMQAVRSTLVDAYKKTELDPETGLGLYSLSSIIVDRAEPSEALKCNTVWSLGLENAQRLISTLQLERFRSQGTVEEEVDIRAERGAYLLHATVDLPPQSPKSWYLVAEVNQGPADVVAVREMLRNTSGLAEAIDADIQAGNDELGRLVGSADGFQQTANTPLDHRHFSNVLYNIQRGGVFYDNYQVEKSDFLEFVESFNQPVVARQKDSINALPDSFNYQELLQQAKATGDQQFLRLCYEYLPITFSRRHGDPSRPWNKFTIDVRDKEGNQHFYYAGNWRDIFQNWEALAYSFPAYIEGMIAKFVNASTPDGYNPYRITRDGIDWEKIEPEDPWSYIGYWGDHQIIYLQKLLEVSDQHHPGRLAELLGSRLFSYANVPYRIKSYPEIVKHPTDTVDYDHETEAKIERQLERLGADGKLVLDDNGEVYQVTLVEKLMVSVLAKFSNFIPEAGIWLNTQRPEWNDANNALVGNGVSMVTLYYMRRFQRFCRELIANTNVECFDLSEEVYSWLERTTHIFEENQYLLHGTFTDANRKKMMDELGLAGGSYRAAIYTNGFSGLRKEVPRALILRFIDLSIPFLDHSIRANRREDGLYHAYNLIKIGDTGVSIRYLYEMLEGQVAVLSSGLLSGGEALDVLKALRKSAMYRADQHSYMLYPDRDLPRYLDKNTIPKESAERSKLLQALIEAGHDGLVEKDVTGAYHFAGDIRNGFEVQDVLDELKETEFGDLARAEEALVRDIFEQVFDHQSFTGRSGTFFAYEGLGSIYWHMVSKLLLATAEVCDQTRKAGVTKELLDELENRYYDIRAGIGFNKSPEEYGAFPSDAYSHTPGNAGAQQPGMTGQVKEDILARYKELGVVIKGGTIHFDPFLQREDEFETQASTFTYFGLDGSKRSLDLPEKAIAFTYCQVPIIYQLGDTPTITVHFSNGKTEQIEGMNLGAELSEQLFGRKGVIDSLSVSIKK
jgi:hypothetical protein